MVRLCRNLILFLARASSAPIAVFMAHQTYNRQIKLQYITMLPSCFCLTRHIAVFMAHQTYNRQIKLQYITMRPSCFCLTRHIAVFMAHQTYNRQIKLQYITMLPSCFCLTRRVYFIGHCFHCVRMKLYQPKGLWSCALIR